MGGRLQEQILDNRNRTAFFTVEVSDTGQRTGTVVEFDRIETIFTNPTDPRTEDYVTGRFG